MQLLRHALRARALAIIDFPTRPGDLDWWDSVDLGRALQQIGQRVVAGAYANTGSILIPYQGRVRMKATMELSGPNGKMWRQVNEYDNLPEAYAWDVGSAAAALGSFVENMQGKAGQGDKGYTITFRADPDGPGGVKPVNVKADRLQYSQAVECQKAGLKMLEKLLLSAEMEIQSGQRQ